MLIALASLRKKSLPSLSNGVLKKAVFIEIALANAKKPELLKGLLLYDFYYKFRPNRDYQPMVSNINFLLAKNQALPLVKVLTKTKEFGAYMASLPLLPKEG